MVLSMESEPLDLDFADDYRKVAAVLLCLLQGGHTIKSLRKCTVSRVPISERVVRLILIRLLEHGYCLYDTRQRRWVPTHKLTQLLSGITDAVKAARALRIW